jgi:rhomboid protease GluP
MTRKEAETFSLVLSAGGIAHRIFRESGTWMILVPQDQQDRANEIISKYLEENRPIDISPGIETRPSVSTRAGAGMALFLAVCYGGTLLLGMETVHDRLKTSAFSVMQSEYYRSATALLMHADARHLIGNMAGIGLFGTWVCQLTGTGVGIGLIVVSGASGNFLNAALYGYGHSSLGASTAVFGALGILVGIRFLDRIRTAAQRGKAWVQVAAGMALLAFLGSSLETDLTAHLFGFITGISIGAGFAFLTSHPPGKRIQIFSLVMTILIVGLSIYRGLSA